MNNMQQIISSNNKKVINKQSSEDNVPPCNCRNKPECPLEGKCLTSNIVYRADVLNLSDHTTRTYLGVCETDFKARYNNHKSSFRYKNKSSSTEL